MLRLGTERVRDNVSVLIAATVSSHTWKREWVDVEGTQIEDFLSREKGRKVNGNFIGGQTLDRIGDGEGGGYGMQYYFIILDM